MAIMGYKIVVFVTCVQFAATEPLLSLTLNGQIRTFHIDSGERGYNRRDAHDFCRSTYENGCLANLDTVEVVDRVQQKLQDRNKAGLPSSEEDLLWLGGQRDVSQQTWTWVKQGDQVQDPVHHVNADGGCLARAFVKGEHVMVPHSCEAQLGQFLCSLPRENCSASMAESGRLAYSPGGGCIVVMSPTGKEYNWYEARNFCVRLGGDLTGPEGKDWTIYSHSGSLWIGAQRHPWKWAETGEISYTYWSRGQPTDVVRRACLAANSAGWQSVSCDRALKYVLCEEIRTITTSSTGSSSQITKRPESPFEKQRAPELTSLPSTTNKKAAPSKNMEMPICIHKYNGFFFVFSGFFGGVMTTLIATLVIRKVMGKKKTVKTELPPNNFKLAVSLPKPVEHNLYVYNDPGEVKVKL